MKKTLFAAIAGGLLAQGAQAQSSVTLYGVVTTSIQYVNHVQNTNNGVLAPGSGSDVFMNSSGIAQSRFGLRGIEDLGGGSRACSCWRTSSIPTMDRWVTAACCSAVRLTWACRTSGEADVRPPVHVGVSDHG
jgi:hypothetical protein